MRRIDLAKKRVDTIILTHPLVKLSAMHNVKRFPLSLKNLKPNDLLPWNLVKEVHKVRHGIYQKKGKLISLLTDFGEISPCYPDKKDDKGEVIFYTGAGRRGNQKLDCFNQALLNAVKSGHAVPLFRKIRVGCWQFLGFWRVVDGRYVFDENQNRMIWQFKLVKVDDPF
jgi:hypothetical protein